jgi:uncharacterized protein with PIN domain
MIFKMMVAKIASQDGRILLTRDRRLLMRRLIRYGYCHETWNPTDRFWKSLGVTTFTRG